MQSEIHKQSANHSVQLRTCDIVTLVQSTTYKSPDVNQILGLLKIVPYDRVQFQHKAAFHREGPNLKVPRSIWWFKTLHRCCHGGSNRFKKTRNVQTYWATLQTKLRNTLEFISWKNAIFRICNSFRYKSSSVLLTVPIIWWFEHKLAFACPCDYIPRLFSCKTSTTIINNCKATNDHHHQCMLCDTKCLDGFGQCCCENCFCVVTFITVDGQLMAITDLALEAMYISMCSRKMESVYD